MARVWSSAEARRGVFAAFAVRARVARRDNEAFLFGAENENGGVETVAGGKGVWREVELLSDGL